MKDIAVYRMMLRVGLQEAWEYQPGLAFAEVMILLNAPFISMEDVRDHLGFRANAGETMVYLHSLFAQDLLSPPSASDPFHRLTSKGESLFTPTRA